MVIYGPTMFASHRRVRVSPLFCAGFDLQDLIQYAKSLVTEYIHLSSTITYSLNVQWWSAAEGAMVTGIRFLTPHQTESPPLVSDQLPH